MRKLILGTLNLPSDAAGLETWLQTAWATKYQWLDLAWIYGGDDNNAIRIGEALKKLQSQGVSFKIQTKIWPSQFLDVETTFAKQLEHLQGFKIDALLLHRPSWNFNETIAAWKSLIALKAAGKVKTIGVSNFDKDMLIMLEKTTKVMPEINQIEHSITNFRFDRILFCRQRNIELQAWSVYGKDVQRNLNNEQVKRIAAKHHATPAQILLAFAWGNKLSPVIGTTKVANLIEDAKIVDLPLEDLAALAGENRFDNRYEETFPH